ncbi:MAG: hypothetical protein H6737_05760 [Alphaproteobacteria bacterium]|nr:hypothetical protein [Alphaproteobacteria bacterium]
MKARIALFAALVACKSDAPVETDPPTPGEAAGLVGDHPLNPFPVGVLHMADGHLALNPDDFDLTTATPLAADRLAWRTGFSPAQTSVLALPDLDPSGFPTWRAPTPGEGSVRLADLTDDVWLPVFAELDAHPDAEPTLLVRPLVAVPYGHQVAVVVTTDATPRVERFGALLSDSPPADLAGHAAHFQGLVDELVALGTNPDDIAIAWDYPVGDGTTPMRSVWSQTALPTSWSFDEVRNADDGDTVVASTFRAATGTYAVTDFLVDDASLQLGADGSVTPTGTADALLYVHIPESVADAPAGTVPVLLMGHGIFSEPANYLDDPDDPSHVVKVADDAGFIVVATIWRGLSFPDRTGAIAAAQDFAKIYEVTDRLVQGQGNVAELIRLVKEGDLLSDPVFQGRQGQALADAAHLRYYGISLGGIQGAVMLANDPPLDGAVLHVGGSTWSTMLERSSNWTAFELFLDATTPDPLVRQRLYAASQLWWDSADPIAYTADLAQRDFLLQESLGDEQVPNMTTRTLARSIGLPQLTPAVEPVWGLDPAAAPLPVGSRAYVQFDPQVGLPPDTNRPAPITEAHDIPRTWDLTANHQTRDFLAVGSEGQVNHYCGADPCTAANAGTP